MFLNPADQAESGGASVRARIDGEIHDRTSLWGLIGGGVGDVERGDDELVAGLYERFGPALVNAIDGSFALIVVDDRDGTFLLARDRFGERPLHYVIGDGPPVASTHPRDLIAVGALDGDLDREAVDRFLAGGTGEESLLAGAAMLPPGHVGTWRAGEGLTLRRYWAPPEPTGGGLETEKERLEELHGLLAKVVARRRERGRDGVILTGVGAALVAAVATPEGGPLGTVSAADLDADLPQRTPDLLMPLDRPLPDPLAPVLLGLAANAAESFDVALSGVGAAAFGSGGQVDMGTVAALSGAPLSVRSPFLNLEVAEFAATVGSLAERGARSPLEDMLRAAGGTPPPPLRPAPLGEWLRGPLADDARRRLGSGRAVEQGLFDGAEATAMLDRHLAGADHGREIWARFVLDVWLESLSEAK